MKIIDAVENRRSVRTFDNPNIGCGECEYISTIIVK